MNPFVNLEESPDKIVGRRRPPADSFKAAMELQRTLIDLSASLRNRFVPRGVYRFKSHEEADEWMWKELAQCKKS